jgi:hypothetical protein
MNAEGHGGPKTRTSRNQTGKKPETGNRKQETGNEKRSGPISGFPFSVSGFSVFHFSFPDCSRLSAESKSRLSA